MNSPLYFITAGGFILLTLAGYGFFLFELKNAVARMPWSDSRKSVIYQRVIFILSGWTLFITVFGIMGFFGDFSTFPPRLMLVLVIPLIAIILMTFLKTTRELLDAIPQRNIIRLQVFRVFVEVLLWMLFLQNLLPVQMSFEGRNFDVLSGLAAPFAAYFLARSRTGIILYNLISLALLANILTIAVLSMPTPLRFFMNEPSNTIVTVFPFIWLPGLLVPLAYGLSFLSLRKLSLERQTINEQAPSLKTL
jgi:hypothetical protein